MIKGLEVTIKGVELRQLCKEQVEHHQERAEFYRQKSDELQDAETEANNYTGGDPVQNLRDSMKRHVQSATEMQFIADHLKLGEEYLLGRDDLARLGVVKSRW